MNTSPLVEIAPPEYPVQVDLIYASADNLAGTVIYRNTRCLLHAEAAACLRKASLLARHAGMTLLIYDAYRPAYAQQLLWQALPNPDYVRDPRLGSHHTRGVAVDLTLIDEHGTPWTWARRLMPWSPSPTSSTPTCRRRCSATACCCWASCLAPASRRLPPSGGITNCRMPNFSH